MQKRIPNILFMEARTIKKEKPHIFFNTLAQLIYVEKWVEFLTENDSDSHLTIMFKLGQQNLNDVSAADLKSKLENYWQKILGPRTEFGLFYNQDIGTVFITGPYTGLFVQEVNGKKLGALPQGLYGILRGLGLNNKETSDALEKLAEGQYLILGRTNIITNNRLNTVEFEGLS